MQKQSAYYIIDLRIRQYISQSYFFFYNIQFTPTKSDSFHLHAADFYLASQCKTILSFALTFKAFFSFLQLIILSYSN